MSLIFDCHVPVLLVGAPGVGKTETVLSSFGHVEVMLASSMVEEDISGLPYRDELFDLRTIPDVFRRLSEADKRGSTTCLFLDELDKARRSVADTLLTLIASRRVAKAKLPARTCIVAAANPPEWGGGDGISDAMLSRFAIVDYVPDVAAWCAWAKCNFSDPPSKSIISAVEDGSLPLIDKTGEDFDRRITCPRTITMCMVLLRSHSLSAARSLIEGIVTPATASHIMHLCSPFEKHSDVMHASTKLVKRFNAKAVHHKPLRV